MSGRARNLLGTAILVIASAVAACHPATAPPVEQPPAVLIETAHLASLPPLVRRGVLVTGVRVRLGFNAPGVIELLAVKPGDRVHKGALLAKLKSGGAAASLRAAEAARVKASRDHEVASRLAGTGSLPSTQAQDARDLLEVARANTALAATTLSDRRILSPIDGMVLQKLADTGEAVGPGVPVLVVDDTEHLVVRVGVTEAELSLVRVGADADLLVGGVGGHVAATVGAVGGAPLADGLFEVEVVPKEVAAHSLRAGTVLSVSFDASSAPSVLAAPLDAIVHRDGKTWVFVASTSGAETRVHLRAVTVDHMDDERVIVRSGLVEGERFVREGAYFLEDGQTVSVLAGTR